MELGVGARELFCAKKLSLPEGSDSSLPAYKSEKGEELCMKKRFLAAALALAMLLMMVPSAFAASDGFDDVPGHWAEDAINRWSGYGVVNGVGDNQFAPNGTLTRAQAAQVFANLLDLEVQADISRYTDVPEGSWYHTAIAQCVAAGILTGTGGATMDPQSPVTREELFVMFARALNIRPQSSSDVTFGDSGEVSGWAQGYINALADRGFVSGVGGGMLAPGEAINRASVMSLLDKTISDYANTSGTTVGNASGVVLVVADNVSVAGDVDTLVVYGGSASVTGSQVAEATVAGENASLSVSGSAVVERVDVAGAEAVLTLTGSVRAGQVTVSGESAQVSLSGQAQAASVAVEETAAGAGLTVGAGSAVTTVDSAAANVTISGSGTVETANVSGNNTTVNTDGTDLTVAQGTTGVTENDKPVSGGTTVETEPETQQPVTPPVHIHSYIATEIKADDAPETTVAVQYTCYAGDHSYIELNDNAAARVGSDYYVDVSNALSAADNATVTMLKDAVFTDTCIVTGTVTLDMNGRTISNTSDIWDQYGGKWSLISVQDNGDLTITGNGTLSTKENDIYAVDVYDATSSCTIESGTFIGNIHAVYVRDGKLTVNGGHFSVQQKYSQEQPDEFVLNCYDANYEAGTARITVTGGTFEKFNPADCEAEGEGTNFVAKGYTVTPQTAGNDIWYTVEPLTAENSAAVVNGVYYENLTDAIVAADGQTITLMTSVTLETNLSLSTELNEVSIDLNQFTLNLTNSSKEYDCIYVGNNEKLTIKNGELNITSGNVGISVGTGGTAVLEGVNYTCNSDPFSIYGNAATAQIVDCTVTAGSDAIYCLSTNAKTSDNYNPKIIITGSTFNATTCGTAILFNVPGTLEIESSTINSAFHSVIARGGDVTIKNSTLDNQISAEDWEKNKDYFNDKNWMSGNGVTLAALTIGNKSPNAYQYPVHCTLVNTTITAGEGQRTVHISGNANEDIGAYLTYDEASNIGTIDYGTGYINVNEEVYTDDSTG